MKRYISIAVFAILSVTAGYAQRQAAMEILDDLEKRLIEKGVLESGDGVSYYRILERVAAGGDFPDIRIAANEFDLLPLKALDIPVDKDKQDALKKAMATIVAEQRDWFTPKAIAGAIISVLSPGDFETPAIKAKALDAIISVLILGSGDNKLPEIAAPPMCRKYIDVYIDGDNNFTVDGHGVHLMRPLP